MSLQTTVEKRRQGADEYTSKLRLKRTSSFRYLAHLCFIVLRYTYKCMQVSLLNIRHSEVSCQIASLSTKLSLQQIERRHQKVSYSGDRQDAMRCCR